MRQRIMFGRFVRGHPRPPVHVPQFGTSCACCNVLTTRTQIYRPPIAVPVCDACADHACGHHGTALAIPVVIIGGMLVAAGAAVHDAASWFFLAGCALLAASYPITRAVTARRRRRLPPGHHPNLEIGFSIGATLLDTDNAKLVEDLLARNPDAQLVRSRLPKATLVD